MRTSSADITTWTRAKIDKLTQVLFQEWVEICDDLKFFTDPAELELCRAELVANQSERDRLGRELEQRARRKRHGFKVISKWRAPVAR